MCKSQENFTKIFELSNVLMNFYGAKREYPKNIKKIIDKVWEKEKKKNTKLFNGRVFSLIDFKIDNDKLLLELQETDYKSFVGTNLNRSCLLNKNEMANPVGFNILLESFDNLYFFALRSKDVQEAQNQWHGVGGNLDSKSLIENIYSEFREEINLNRKDIEKIKIIGMVENCISKRKEILIYAKSYLVSDEIENNLMNATDKFEYSVTEFISLEKLQSFKNEKNVTNTTKALIEAYFKVNKGEL